LARYEKDKEIARFGVDLPESTKDEIDLGEKIELVFNQDTETLVPPALSLMLMGLLLGDFWKRKKSEQVKVDLIKLTQKFQQGKLTDFLNQMKEIGNVEELIKQMKAYSQKVSEVLYE
jgi:F0F1-type ATP synthase alpha subunit